MEKSLNGSMKFMKLQERILSDHWGFQFMNNDFFLKPFNRIMTQLFESGIADHIVKSEAFVRYETSEDKPVILTFYHLGVWFFLLIFLLALSILVFIIESQVH